MRPSAKTNRSRRTPALPNSRRRSELSHGIASRSSSVQRDDAAGIRGLSQPRVAHPCGFCKGGERRSTCQELLNCWSHFALCLFCSTFCHPERGLVFARPAQRPTAVEVLAFALVFGLAFVIPSKARNLLLLLPGGPSLRVLQGWGAAKHAPRAFELLSSPALCLFCSTFCHPERGLVFALAAPPCALFAGWARSSLRQPVLDSVNLSSQGCDISLEYCASGWM